MLYQNETRPAPVVTENRPQDDVRFGGLDILEITTTPWKIQRLIDRRWLTPAVGAVVAEQIYGREVGHWESIGVVAGRIADRVRP